MGVQDIRDLERFEEARRTLWIMTWQCAVPFYLLYWFLDIIRYPGLKWELLAIRALIVPVALSMPLFFKGKHRFSRFELFGLIYTALLALPLFVLYVVAGDPGMYYYCGAYLFLVGATSVVPWSTRFYLAIGAILFLAFNGVYYLKIPEAQDPAKFLPLVTTFICIFIMLLYVRHFNEQLRLRETEARLQLKDEIENRNKIITEQAHALSQMSIAAAKKELEEENNKRISMIAKRTAHDIRSPLSALAVIAKASDCVGETEREIVQKAITRINDIANEILNIGKYTLANQEGTRYGVHQLDDLVFEIVREKETEFSEKNVKFTFKRCDSNPNAFCDKTEMQRILSNLINNAVEAVEKDGRIAIEIFVQSDTSVGIRLTDNGKGIPNSILDRIGDRGFTYGKKGGNGLGIYFAKETLNRWGGSLNIQSVEDAGTTIEIVLPRIGNTQSSENMLI